MLWLPKLCLTLKLETEQKKIQPRNFLHSNSTRHGHWAIRGVRLQKMSMKMKRQRTVLIRNRNSSHFCFWVKNTCFVTMSSQLLVGKNFENKSFVQLAWASKECLYVHFAKFSFRHQAFHIAWPTYIHTYMHIHIHTDTHAHTNTYSQIMCICWIVDILQRFWPHTPNFWRPMNLVQLNYRQN